MTSPAAASSPPTPSRSTAEWLARRYGDTSTVAGRAIRELGSIDRAVYDAVAATPSPTIDRSLRRLTEAASYSRLWFGIALGLALVGGRRGRAAAATGITAIAITSIFVNQGVKRLSDRPRPDRDEDLLADEREARMPSSSSFPSGHSASAFAFSVAVGDTVPALALPLRLLAGAVAYSRVHTGVHYPGDVVAGALIGGGVGDMTATVGRAVRVRRRARSTAPPGPRPSS